MKTLPISKVITLTEQTTSTAINIVASLIQRIDTDTGGSCLLPIGRNGSIKNDKLFVTQSPAAIAASSGIHIQLTEYVGGLSYYLNAMCIWQLFDETTYRVVSYNLGGQTLNVKVTQSLASLQAAINAANNNAPANAVALIAGGINQATATLATVVAGETTIFTVSGATTPSATSAGVRLSSETTLGTKAILYNSSSSFFLLVYPASGGSFDNLGTNAAFALPPLTAVEFNLAAANAWESSIVQSAQDVRAGGTGVTGNATEFWTSSNRLNLVSILVANNASNGIRPILNTISDGTSILFMNTSSNAYAQAFPPDGGNYGLGSDIPLQIPPSSSVLVVLTATSGWRIAYGFNVTTQSGVASTTQTQAAGTLVHQNALNMSTVANAGDAFTLSRALRQFTATNATANAAQVFPPVGGTIDALGANASCTVYPGSTLVFTSNDGLAWKLSGTRSGTSVFNGAGGLFTVADTNIRATSTVSVSTTSIAATTAVGFSTAITAATGFTTTNFDAAAAVVADTRTTAYVINY